MPSSVLVLEMHARHRSQMSSLWRRQLTNKSFFSPCHKKGWERGAQGDVSYVRGTSLGWGQCPRKGHFFPTLAARRPFLLAPEWRPPGLRDGFKPLCSIWRETDTPFLSCLVLERGRLPSVRRALPLGHHLGTQQGPLVVSRVSLVTDGIGVPPCPETLPASLGSQDSWGTWRHL